MPGGDVPVPVRGLRERRVPPPELGGVLRAARQRAGLGLRELGRLVGLSPGYLVNLEGGLRCPSRTVAVRLADALGLAEGERAVLMGAAVGDAGLDHPWRAAS